MKTLPALAVSSLILLIGRAPANAEDYQGAEAILHQVEAQSEAAHDPSKKPDAVRQWREDLKRYQEHTATLAPDEAARSWLDLFDRAFKLPASPGESAYGGSTPLRLLEVWQAFPPPADWDALAARIAARPAPEKGSGDFTTAALKIIAATLQNQPAAIGQAIDAFKQQADNIEGPQQSTYAQYAQSLREALFDLSGDKKGALAQFEAKLAQFEPGAHSIYTNGDGEISRMNDLEVPNLVALAGAARAEALLRKVFALDLHGITVRDEDTKALARKVALDMGDRLKFAPWDLVDTPDALALYDLLVRRFPGGSDDRTARQQADAYHLLGLIVAGRDEEATKAAVQMGDDIGRRQYGGALGALSEEALSDLAAKGYAQEVYKFLDRLLADHPELLYWSDYTTAAVLAGETDAMLARVKAASERTDLKPGTQAALRRAYAQALLAADHVSEALPLLREAVLAKKRAGGTVQADEARETAEAAVTLAGLAELLGDKTLLNEQLDIVVDLAKTQPGIVDRVSVRGGGGLIELFLSAGRGPDAERLLAANLLQAERALKESPALQVSAYLALAQEGYYFQGTRTPLFALTDLYSQAGRYEDIVALLDHADLWGARDVAGLAASNYGYGDHTPFLLQAARALQKTGHADAALRVLNAYLEHNGGSDPGYALLLELLPPDKAEARLNELFQGDQFEERPLIWRAVLQLGQGRLDEAEKSARQAIGIDPSDGEEGRGDRMRAYAVLGDILERKGDTEKAAQMRQAVQAIRLSEDADRFHSAGLLTRAVAMYKKALGYFSDAYCIQSRLAIQLTALGKLDEAAAHYERAYELMPESFGRMESHCFGCERVFAGKRAQSAAERVFQKFVAQQPTNPRVHYLLGYLRMEEDRKAEAASEFGEAVKLDPDYINAWKQLAATTDDTAVRDRAELNLLRLDPRQKHDSVDLTTIGDLRALWTALETAAKVVPPAATTLYPLEASATFLQQLRERQPHSPTEDENGMGHLVALFNLNNEHLTPPIALLKNKVIAQALQLLPRNESGVPPY